jgi:HlyD family secretion protein
MALLDSDTLHVEGYFEETKLPRIHTGDAVNVRLLGSHHPLRGTVESVAAGSKIAIAAPAQPSLPTSIRRSTGYGWPNVFPSESLSTAPSATNSLREPRIGAERFVTNRTSNLRDPSSSRYHCAAPAQAVTPGKVHTGLGPGNSTYF